MILFVLLHSANWKFFIRTELKTTTIPKYSPCPIERDSKYRVKTDVAQPETKKNDFSPLSKDGYSIYESRNIALFPLRGIIYSKLKYVISIIKVCCVTQQISRAYVFISSTVSETDHFQDLHTWLSLGGSSQVQVPNQNYLFFNVSYGCIFMDSTK